MERDPLIDALRATALFIVVVGHFMMAGVWWDDGHLEIINVLKLDDARWAHWLTWAFQPMIVLFAVGAWANASSWSRLPSKSPATETWLSGRVRRMCIPAATFAVTVTLMTAVVHPFAPGMAGVLSRRLAMPLWFLAMYLPLTALTPALVRLARRHGWGSLGAMALAIVLVDVVGRGVGIGWVAWLNVVLVWATAAQAGTLAALNPTPNWHVLAGVAAGALATLLLLVAADAYPISMIGIEARSNTLPPSAALGLLGATQLALLAWCAAPLRRLVSRPRPRALVDVFGAAAMHVYLWHLSALIVIVGLMRVGVFNVMPLDTAWWWSRPVVVALLLAVVMSIALIVGRADLRMIQRRSAAAGQPRAVVACMLATTGLAIVTALGFGPGVLPLAGTLAIVLGARMATSKVPVEVSPAPSTGTFHAQRTTGPPPAG